MDLFFIPRALRLRAVATALLLILILHPQPAAAGQGGRPVKVAVLPWTVLSAKDMDFVKKAVMDMLTSRIGAKGSVEVARADIVRSVLQEVSNGEVTEGAALETGKRLGVDYVLYGSLSFMGELVSMDAKLLDVAGGASTAFYSEGKGLDSVIGLTGKIASGVVKHISGTGGTEKGHEKGYSGRFAKEEEPDVPAPEPVVAPPAGAPSAGVKGGVKEEAPAGKRPVAKEGGFIERPESGPFADKGLWKSRDIEGFMLSMVIADLDGDGKKELFLASKRDIAVYDPGSDGLKELKRIKGDTWIRNVSISAFDRDGDGKEELYISRLRDGRPSGCVLQYVDGEYRITREDIGWLMRAVDIHGMGRVLVGQRFIRNKGFSGSPFLIDTKDGKIAEGQALDLPSGIDLYRFAYFDVTGDGSAVTVVLGERGYLNLYRKDEKGRWKRFWKSPQYYGGSLNAVEFKEDVPQAGETGFVLIEKGPVWTDLDGDGMAELLLRRNEAPTLSRIFKRIRSFKSGSIVDLAWDGASLSELWRTKDISGYVSDFRITDLDGDGKKELFILVVEGAGKLFGKEKSYVLSYKLGR